MEGLSRSLTWCLLLPQTKRQLCLIFPLQALIKQKKAQSSVFFLQLNRRPRARWQTVTRGCVIHLRLAWVTYGWICQTTKGWLLFKTQTQTRRKPRFQHLARSMLLVRARNSRLIAFPSVRCVCAKCACARISERTEQERWWSE